MKKLTITAAAALLAASFSAQAALESRAGGAAYYDTDTNLTWTTSINPVSAKTVDQHNEFFADFFLPGWRIPTDTEIRDITNKTFTCEFLGVCTINEPFHRDGQFSGKWLAFQEDVVTGAPDSFYAHGLDGKLYQGFSPETYDYDGSQDGSSGGVFEVWPVHNGDFFKPAVVSAVPEPSTYAMLIAGILLVSIGRKFV